MKIRLLSLALILAFVPVAGLRAEAAKPVQKAEKPETELEQTMGRMGKAWRQVRKAARDGKLTPATAEFVATVRTNAEAAAKLTPALEAEKPAADRARFQADYVAQIKKLVTALTALETALRANDTATATKLVADVGDLMKSGHHDFRKPEERH